MKMKMKSIYVREPVAVSEAIGNHLPRPRRLSEPGGIPDMAVRPT